MPLPVRLSRKSAIDQHIHLLVRLDVHQVAVVVHVPERNRVGGIVDPITPIPIPQAPIFGSNVNSSITATPDVLGLQIHYLVEVVYLMELEI